MANTAQYLANTAKKLVISVNRLQPIENDTSRKIIQSNFINDFYRLESGLENISRG